MKRQGYCSHGLWVSVRQLPNVSVWFCGQDGGKGVTFQHGASQRPRAENGSVSGEGLGAWPGMFLHRLQGRLKQAVSRRCE